MHSTMADKIETRKQKQNFLVSFIGRSVDTIEDFPAAS